MKVRTVVFACAALLGLGYVASPYVALYRLGTAAQRGDVGTLAAAIDWDAVREGLKEDICDTVLEDASPRVRSASAQAVLPPFGASFFAGIAAKVVDDTVTPDGLVAMLHHDAPDATARPAAGFGWSFFDGPSSFTARLVTAPGTAPILLHLRFRAGHWRVIRADLPPSMLSGMQAHA